jgi:hypothetical protein
MELAGVKIRKGNDEILGKSSIRFEFGFDGHYLLSTDTFSQLFGSKLLGQI